MRQRVKSKFNFKNKFDKYFEVSLFHSYPTNP